MSQQLSQSPNLNLLNNQLNHRLSNTLNIASTSSNQDNSELISSPPKRRRNSSPVWAYVKKAEKDTDKHKCNQFGYSKEWSFKTGASTIAIHLSNVHEITCKESELLQVVKKTESKLYNPDQIKMDNLLINFIIDDNQSFNTVNSQRFIDFCKAMNPFYVVPERHTIAERIKNKFDSSYSKIKSILKDLESKVIFFNILKNKFIFLIIKIFI